MAQWRHLWRISRNSAQSEMSRETNWLSRDVFQSVRRHAPNLPASQTLVASQNLLNFVLVHPTPHTVLNPSILHALCPINKQFWANKPQFQVWARSQRFFKIVFHRFEFLPAVLACDAVETGERNCGPAGKLQSCLVNICAQRDCL